jgi:hypothetical protein
MNQHEIIGIVYYQSLAIDASLDGVDHATFSHTPFY